MLFVNPFTGMTINANPKGCNQYSGPECAYKGSLIGSYEAIKKEAGIPIDYGEEYSAYIPDSTGTLLGDVLSAMGRPTHARIQVKSGPLERAIAAHETGHHKNQHQEGGWDPEQERQAWRWALKNRKKLAISKRKIRQAVRMAEVSGDLPRNTLLTRR